MFALKRRLFLLALALCVLSGLLPVQAHAALAQTLPSAASAYGSAGAYMVQKAPNPSYGDEWFIISLARGGYKVPANYYDIYYTNLVKEVREREGELHSRKYTEYSRVILALSAIGKDARNVGGYNLVQKLFDFNNVSWQGINGPIFALIALDTWQYEMPETAANSRDEMIQYLLDNQLNDGGFALSGAQIDPDITAMAVQALSTYRERKDVAEAIDHAIDALGAVQLGSSESISQLITALTSLSIDPAQDDRFNGVMGGLLQYYDAAGGGFKHLLDEAGTNAMATEQAAYALASYERMLAGDPKLYDMTDTKPAAGMYSDVLQHWGAEAIDEASKLGLMKGYPDGTFRPDVQLTRAQAASLIARALKLQHAEPAPYSDISKYSKETQGEIAALYEAGIIASNNGKFNPDRKLTRAELALMLARGYYYHTGQRYEAAAWAPFADIAALNDETKQAVTFLYDYKIAEGSNGKFNPSGYTTRAHAAKMFVGFYQLVN